MSKPTQLSLFAEPRQSLKRSQVLPLHEPAAIYAVLSRLEIGQMVPPQVLTTDYTDGTISPWTVREIEQHGPALILTVCDESIFYPSRNLLDQDHCTAMDILTLPTKTLTWPFYGYYPGCVHPRNKLADIRQHARQLVDKARKAERQVVA